MSQAEVERFLDDAQRLLRSNTEVRVRVDSVHYRTIAVLNHQIFEAAKIIAGTDRPWPVYSSTGPC